MKILVTYYSQTGNTEKIARAIFDAIQTEKDLIPVQELQSVEGYDIIFCGFPVHAHSVPGKVHSLFKKLPQGQHIAFFCTHGSLRGGHLPKQALEHAISLTTKAKVLGSFACRGKVDPQVLSFLVEKPEHRAWAEEAMGADGHPDEADLAEAKNFVRTMIAKLH